MKRYRIIAVVIAGAVLLLGCSWGVTAQQEEQPMRSGSDVQSSEVPDEQEVIRGYPPKSRRIGTPTDVEWDLDDSFPKSGSVLEWFLRYLEDRPNG